MAWKSIDQQLPEDRRSIIVFCNFGGGYQIEGWYDRGEGDFYAWDGEWLEHASHWDELRLRPR